MKLLIISLCTQGVGVLKEYFIYYARRFAKKVDLYCITNDNVSNADLGAIETLNVSYVHSDPFGYFSQRKILSMKKFIDKVNPDIIYVFTHHTSNLFLTIVLKGKNVIYHVHDPEPHFGVSLIEKFILSTQLKLFSRFAKKLVVSANAIKEKTLEVISYNPNDIEVIPQCLLDNFVQDEVMPSDKDIDFLFYGKIRKYKGLDVLIEAAYILEQDGIRPSIYICGGLEFSKIYPGVKFIPTNVHFEGYVDDKTLVSYIKKTKALVLPYHEASGSMTVNQAFYYGTPVIATDVGCFPEYVKDGGIICMHSDAKSLANAIKKMFFDEKLRMRLSINAKRIYNEQFTIDSAIDKHISLFNRVINESK